MRVAKQLKPVVEDLVNNSKGSSADDADRVLSDMREAFRFYDWLNRFADFLESGMVFESLPKDLTNKSTENSDTNAVH